MHDTKKVLVIEDDVVDAEFVIRTLKRDRRYETYYSTDLKGGIYALKQFSFDLVLLDLDLPDATHQESIQAIQNLNTGAPIVIFTGQNDIQLALQKLRDGVQDYLIKGKSTQDELKRCIAYAIERNRLQRIKDEFISIVSHELRTPMTAIVGSIGLLLSGATGSLPEKALNTLGIANRNCDRLLRLINDLLDMQKIQSGKMKLELEPINVHALVSDTVAVNTSYADKYDVSLENRFETDVDLNVFGDQGRLNQVITNLISNAVKFSPVHSSVTIHTESLENNSVMISITDQGEGIPDDFKDKIFGKFMQADSSITRNKGGTGLGLNICKSIINLHGGTIGFSSEEGVGTSFYFTLPIHRDE